uniref:Major facilitator superfamily (MFS) profile domain-containing protein n=2 Tax=Clastoptera arizonana TaxID=38151 RepID=A0A1B6EC40_9HEMI
MEARTILWFIVFCGFAVNYMVRININIAMVAMAKSGQKNQVNSTECYSTQNTNFSLESGNLTNINNVKKYDFDWDEKKQNLILGAFFWFHWVLQIPGGVLARKFGTKAVFGLSNFATVLLTFVVPWCAYTDYRLLVANRVIQGIIVGMAWPSMQHLTAHWIPPDERSKFVSAYLGSSVGVAVTYPLCGVILDFLPWEAVFYVTGTIGTVWFILWWYLVYDTPAEHPTITAVERKYIEDSLGNSLSRKKLPIPWKDIFTSVPVWMVLISQWGGGWALFTLMTQAPTYFSVILGWDIKMTGIWSGLPHLCRWIFSLSYGIFSDYLLKTKTLSRTNVRKLAVGFCNVLQAVLVLGLAFTNCNSTAAILLLVSATAVHGGVSAGPLANVVDISPNFASILQGVAGLVANTPGFVSSYIVGLLTYQNQTIEQWRIVFLITSGMLVSTGSLYLIFAKSEIQSWNGGYETREQTEEQEALRTDKELHEVQIVKTRTPIVKMNNNGNKA